MTTRIIAAFLAMACVSFSAAWAQSAISTTTEQQTRIRACIYVLRSHNVFSRTEEWATAVRELVQIGEAAVPDLVAELNRTNRDAELRGLAFTLRAIGDPRAVPALISALPRTRTFTSDCGIPCVDADLLHFMQQNAADVDPNPKEYFGYGRSVREIATALETLTGHSEGTDYLQEPNSREAEDEVARVRALRQSAADRWADWWKQNGAHFVPEDVQQHLTDNAASADQITAAGLTVFGPTFPNERKPGPAIEVTLPSQNHSVGEMGPYYSFSAGRGFDAFEDAEVSDSISAWFAQRGVGAYVSTYLSPGPEGEGQEYYNPISKTKSRLVPALRLEGHNVSAWQVETTRWNSIDQEFATGKPIDPGERGPMPDFQLYVEDARPAEIKPEMLPVTFLFDTTYGEKGILQITEMNPKAGTMLVRYRLFGGPVARFAAPLPLPDDRGATFGPTTEVVLNDYQSDRPSALSLQTGETSAVAPKARKLPFAKELHEWMADHGMDLVTRRFGKEGGGVGGLCGLGGHDMAIRKVRNSAFDRMTPGQVLQAVERSPTRLEAFVSFASPPSDPLPVTCAFATHDGTIGLLQITGSSEEEGTIALRYKVLQNIPK